MRSLIFTIGLIPSIAIALSYDTELPYTDSAPDRATAVSVGALTEEGILGGKPDGTFRYTRLLNRAEFMKITMLLHQSLQRHSFIDNPIDLSCFPDIAEDAWFAEPVCRAKQFGIVHGNAQKGIDPQFWFFEPSRSVQYEEALKVLINIYDIQPDLCIECKEEWYEPYIRAAKGRNLDLNLIPGHKLTRGQVSRLVARFVVIEEGTLQDLLNAENGVMNVPQRSDESESWRQDDGEDQSKSQSKVNSSS